MPRDIALKVPAALVTASSRNHLQAGVREVGQERTDGVRARHHAMLLDEPIVEGIGQRGVYALEIGPIGVVDLLALFGFHSGSLRELRGGGSPTLTNPAGAR